VIGIFKKWKIYCSLDMHFLFWESTATMLIVWNWTQPSRAPNRDVMSGYGVAHCQSAFILQEFAWKTS